MATVNTQVVVGDTGSQEVARLISNFNALVTVLNTMITSMKTTAGFVADLQTIATTAETSLVANVTLLEQKPNIKLSSVGPTS